MTYWEEHGSHGLYQMGPNMVRSYVLETIKDLKVRNVLDVGCGSGPIYDLISKDDSVKARYVGSDYSSSFMETCKKHFPEGTWVVDDMRTLTNFRDKEFDMVLSMHALDHIDDWMKALDAMYRVSDKYVMIVLWRPFSQGDINTSHHQEYEDSHLTEFNQEELEEYMKNIGFDLKVSEKMMNGKQYNYIYLLEKNDK